MFFIKYIVKNNNKWAIFGLFFCILVIAVIFSSNVKAEILVPTAEPPNDNTAGFLQIGEMTQGKSGPLRLGTSDVAAPFNYQLEVLGEGADVSNALIENNLTVSDTLTGTNETLYVDSTNHKVCLGPCLGVPDSKLDISDRGMIINATGGRGLNAYSDNNEAIFSQGALGGIHSVSSGNNSSIKAVSTTGTAVEGINLSNSYSSVLGFSDKGIGIYGTNVNFLGLWSAYFDGRLESNTDISASKFLSANKFNSLVPHTVGQTVKSFNLGNAEILLHDGTNIWLAEDDKIIKARGSDGFQLFEITGVTNPSSIIYDGEFIWIAYADGILKVNPADGSTEECPIVLDNPRSIVFTGDNYWVTDNGTGELVNLAANCTPIGIPVSLVVPADYSLGKIIYNGSYLWVLATNDTTGAGSVININPSSQDAIRWDGLIGSDPVDILYDNYYYWVLNNRDGTITRFYLQNNKVCSELNVADPVPCQTNDNCAGFGSCSFAIPQEYGVYPVSTDISHSSNTPVAITQDGQNIWIINQWTDSGNNNYAELIRMPMADPDSAESFSLNMTPTNIAFDGTMVWVSSADGGLVNIYSGSGYGSTDLSDTAALQSNNPLTSQSGNFSIDGTGNFQGDAVGEGNLISLNNIWGESESGDVMVGDAGDPNVPLPVGAHNCPNGHFITFISENSFGQVNRIECKPL